MCGILGAYSKDKTRKINKTFLNEGCDIIRYRGPDDEGYFLDGNIGFGVRRLSVIDISGGHQPVHNEDETLWVILNGEIYNYPELRQELIRKGHVFYTNSDTEVIVHLYEDNKEKCAEKLSGMFAFAVLDAKKRTLFIARDRIGVKPLYYYEKGGFFAFASEIKAVLNLIGSDRNIDRKSLYHFFSLNYVPGPETVFEDIKQLLPGHYLVADENGVRINQYWEVSFNGRMNAKEEEILEQLEQLLKKSVKRMLRSEVPLGAFLSGGMDSSTLVSLMSEFSGKSLKTFSVGFRDDSYDETNFAELVSRRFQTDHYRIECVPQDVIQNLPKIVWHADCLLSDPSMLPLYLVAHLARQHVTVCFSGDGGDEMFMGYPTYLADKYLGSYKRIPLFLRNFVIEKLVRALPVSNDKLSFEYKAKKFVEGAIFSPEKAHYWWRTVFSDSEKQRLFSDDAIHEIGSTDSYLTYSRYYDKSCGSSFDKFSYADMKVWLADNNLIRVDAMSMAHSLEVRVPFLDHELVEFIMQVPVELKMKNGQLKYLLKKLMKDKLPDEIIHRRKAGWHVPLGKWFRNELRDYVRETLSSRKVLSAGIFNENYIDTLLNDHFRRRRNNVFKIWGLLVFFKWYEIFC